MDTTRVRAISLVLIIEQSTKMIVIGRLQFQCGVIVLIFMPVYVSLSHVSQKASQNLNLEIT